MSNLFWLTEAQMEHLKPFFPTSYGKPYVSDRCILSVIIIGNRIGLHWCDALGLPSEKLVLPQVGFLSQIKAEEMGRQRHTPEETVATLRQVDFLVSQGRSVAEAV